MQHLEGETPDKWTCHHRAQHNTAFGIRNPRSENSWDSLLEAILTPTLFVFELKSGMRVEEVVD